MTRFANSEIVELALWQPPLALLVVAPHPDDEVAGPGGLARLVHGDGMAAVVVTDGARGAGGTADPGLKDVRRAESVAGLKILGARFGAYLNLSSAQLKTDPTAAAATAIREVYDHTRPQLVVTPAPFEKHPTHRATTRATIAALKGTGITRLWGYPVWSPIPGEEDVIVQDITTTMRTKLDALRCHESQISVRPFDEAIRCLNRADAIMAETTGSARNDAFLERYVDLTPLVKDNGPPLRLWLEQRSRHWLKTLLG